MSWKFILIVPIMVLIAATTKPGTAQAPGAQAPATANQDANREKNLEAGEVEAKQMLVLMDRDQNGKVSHQEFMKFMEEEFQRLDVNKDGELDVKELIQSRFVPRGGRHR